MGIGDKHSYLNTGIDCLVSASIREYDMKAAGMNMLISCGLLSDKTIDKLLSMDKRKRNIKIGLMQRNNKELSAAMNTQFIKYRNAFIEANEVDEASVLSIKKDAIFIVNHRIKKTMFDNVQFVVKNKYTSYYYMNKIEFYYNEEKTDIKGLGKENEIIHKDYMLRFLRKIFRLAEGATPEVVMKKLYNFSNEYRDYELDIEYYREMNDKSLFRLKTDDLMGNSLGLIYQPREKKSIDIRYNYLNYIVPLIRMFY